jgi:hypothetical protein
LQDQGRHLGTYLMRVADSANLTERREAAGVVGDLSERG